MQRDVPEPALLVRCLQDQRGSLVLAGVAVGALPVGPDGSLVQHGVPYTQLEAVLQEPALPAGVHDDLRPHEPRYSIVCLDPDADGPAILEEHIEHASAL